MQCIFHYYMGVYGICHTYFPCYTSRERRKSESKSIRHTFDEACVLQHILPFRISHSLTHSPFFIYLNHVHVCYNFYFYFFLFTLNFQYPSTTCFMANIIYSINSLKKHNFKLTLDVIYLRIICLYRLFCFIVSIYY